jgi:hypothetical protein
MKLTLICVVLAGCGTTIQTTAINPAPRPLARSPDSVEVFTTGAPPRPHVDVALLEAEQDSSYSLDDTAAMLAKLRERGAAMGCDALVFHGLASYREELVGDQVQSRKGVYATCIVYTTQLASAPPP